MLTGGVDKKSSVGAHPKGFEVFMELMSYKQEDEEAWDCHVVQRLERYRARIFTLQGDMEGRKHSYHLETGQRDRSLC